MTDKTPGLRPWGVFLVALSLSIGWGVRGNWGHEYGAMIPGALAAIAAVLISGRDDWHRRLVHFAFFGALGWSFGGSISYMQVIAFTHSGHMSSTYYGFANLFIIGFLWAVFAGAGTALPAVLDRERMTEFYPVLIALFLAWQIPVFAPSLMIPPEELGQFYDGLDWWDTDWLSAGVALLLAPLIRLFQRRWTYANALMMWMAAGWWVGFILFTEILDLHMTQPRGDSWAGVLGMAVGMVAFFLRQKQHNLVHASLLAGIWGGFGFSFAQFVKLLEIKTGYETNWHSVLEQSYGFINGLGIAFLMGLLSTRLPLINEADAPSIPVRPWTDTFALLFVLLVITYVNIVKNVQYQWLNNPQQAKQLYFMSFGAWFNLGYAVLAVAITALALAHRRRALAFIPANPVGRGQLFYLLFLWWIVLGNAARVIPLPEQRLITEGVIHVNACVCTLLIALLPGGRLGLDGLRTFDFQRAWIRLAPVGLAVWIAVTILPAWGTYAVWRGIFEARDLDKPMTEEEFKQAQGISHATLHVRFGPNRTAVPRYPKEGEKLGILKRN